MQASTSQRLILTLCACALILLAFDLAVNLSIAGRIGISSTTATGTPFLYRIGFAPHSPAERAGLRTGDVIDMRRLPANDRYRWFGAGFNSGALFPHLRAGARVPVPVVGPTSLHFLPVVAEKRTAFAANVWLGYAGIFWLALFAALLAWRRPANVEARVLALLLVLWAIGIGLAANNFLTPSAATDAIVGALSQVVSVAACPLLAVYAMLFARPASPLRRVLAGLSYVSAAIVALWGVAYVANVWAATLDPGGAWFDGPLEHVVASLPALFALLCLLATIAQARGPERTRISWAAASLGPFYAVEVAATILFAFPATVASMTAAQNVVLFIAPLGLTYSVLNRRLLDLGFAISRAAAFSCVSVLVVGTFLLAEWLLGDWLRRAGHVTNVAVSGAIALALGLSVRALLSRTNDGLANLFFRKRHEDLKAIRACAHEIAYITDAAVLVRRIQEILERHAGASFVHVALDDGTGRFGTAGENDPAIVALRAWRKVLDLHAISSQLLGELAYPMVARGRLVGALVLGPRLSGEPYAPDESEAVAQLADAAGTALDLLTHKGAASPEAILEAIRALPDAIVERLRAAGAPR